MKTVNIKGKEYVEVNERERVIYFSANWTIIKDIIKLDGDDLVITKTSIIDKEDGRVIATRISATPTTTTIY